MYNVNVNMPLIHSKYELMLSFEIQRKHLMKQNALFWMSENLIRYCAVFPMINFLAVDVDKAQVCCKLKYHSLHIILKLSWNWFGGIAAEEAVKHSNNSKYNPKSRSFKHFVKSCAKVLYLTLNQVPGFEWKYCVAIKSFRLTAPLMDEPSATN